MTQKYTSKDLYKAVENNDAKKVISIAESNSEIINSHIGIKALDEAVKGKRHEIAELLLDFGVAPYSRKGKYDPLSTLVYDQPDKKMFDLFMSKDLDFSASNADEKIRERISLHLAHWAIQHNDLALLKELEAKSNIEIINSDIGIKALDEAVKGKQHDRAELLIDFGVAPYSRKGNYEPLYTLVYKQPDQKMFDLFMSKSLDYSASNTDEEIRERVSGRVANWAIKHNDLELLKEFVANGLDVQLLDKRGSIIHDVVIQSAVFNKSAKGKKDEARFFPMIEFLIDEGADINNKSRKSPLLGAIESKLNNTVDFLLSHGASFSSIGYKYQGPLYHLLSAKCTNQDWLISAIEADDLKTPTKNKEHNPVYVAIRNVDINSIRLMVDHGLDLNFLDDNNQSYLSWAIKNVREEDAYSWITGSNKGRLDVLKYFIKSGIDSEVVNTIDSDNRTPLDMCKKRPWLSNLVKNLVAIGAKTSEDILNGSFESDALLQIANVVDRNEAWIEYALEDLKNYSDIQNQLWFEFIVSARAVNSNKPTKKLIIAFEQLLDAIGKEKYLNSVLQWVDQFKNKRLVPLGEYLEGEWYTPKENANLAKWLMHFCAQFNDREIAKALRDAAIVMYKKIPDFGSRNTRIANAAVQALSDMDLGIGAKEIVILRSSIKYSVARKNIDKFFDALAEKHQMNTEELESMGVPDLGMSSLGYLEKEIGEYTGVLTVAGLTKVDLVWKKGDDKEQKSVPAAIKDKYKDEIKELKDIQKDIKKVLSGQVESLQALYLRSPKRVQIEFGEFNENYLNHPILGLICRDLIWEFISKSGKSKLAIFSDGKIVDVNCNPICNEDIESVQLWHPIASKSEEVAQWQSYILENEISQPFKQAFREIYRLPEDNKEQKQVDDFAGHMLFPNVLHAVATGKKWKQIRGGAWDGGSEIEATKIYKDHSIMAYFDIEPDEEAGPELSGMHYVVRSEKLSFKEPNSDIDYKDYSEQDKYYLGETILLSKVPPIIYSETMRDIDIFVSSANVFHQKNWDNPNSRNQWIKECFGALTESGLIRKQVLSELAPKLAIHNKLKIDDRFLFVEGKLKTYKIHIGSACILMEPDDKYLCIVKSQNKTKKMFLPFEGDGILSEVLSKAMLLAADDKIKDETISSQII